MKPAGAEPAADRAGTPRSSRATSSWSAGDAPGWRRRRTPPSPCRPAATPAADRVDHRRAAGCPARPRPRPGPTTSPTTVQTHVAGRLGRAHASGTSRRPGPGCGGRWRASRRCSPASGSTRAAPVCPGSGSSPPSRSGARWRTARARRAGSSRGSGGLPSITSSSAFSSPNRYSSGPATTVIVAVAADAGRLHLAHGAGDRLALAARSWP